MKACFSGVEDGSDGSVCMQCKVQSYEAFSTFVHAGQDLKRLKKTRQDLKQG